MWVTGLLGAGFSTELVWCFQVPRHLFCLGAGKCNGGRNLGTVSTRQLEMVSVCYNTLDGNQMLLFHPLLLFHRETRLYRCHHSTERGLCGARGNFSASFLVCRRQVRPGACWDLCFIKLRICQCSAGLLVLLPLLVPSASGFFPNCYESLKKILSTVQQKSAQKQWNGLCVAWWLLCVCSVFFQVLLTGS